MSIYERLFRGSAALVLVLTAGAKLLSATGPAPILDHPDPLLGLANRQVLVLVGLLELAVTAALLMKLPVRMKHLLLLWLGSNFLIYRLALFAIKPGQPCPCLGNLTERLHLSPSAVNLFLWFVVIYLVIGSSSVLFRLRQNRVRPRALEVRAQHV